ncbi:hypothetical protein DFR65_102332 [Oceanihabitans sediminis]|uniref:Uncharacterized protein n=1 Tax=Oceanihabitans sediminis TaxID=1812012 RepID=A0A368P3P4_9FLAO|nr:hypothetical protein [Oceanihabitans sediminis]RBP32996.1 hypothetical protein DFR65_102332 [Oceanihabitans sediminis]RCU57487.1 hypothetical protein DU428_06740 [Oceanihabitans sediminis]
MNEFEVTTRFSNNYSNEEIAASIGKIARENFANKHPITNEPLRISRRELVSILNRKHENLNLADSIEFNQLVRLSYEMSIGIVQEAIVKTIKANIGNDSVYNPHRLYPSNHVSQFSENENSILTTKVNLLKANSTEIDSKNAKSKIETTLVKTQNLEFKKVFLGIGNADNAKKYAQDVLSGYEMMIWEYDKIKNVILNLANDFHILRNELKSEREDVIQLLIDLLGSRAKQQYPELFDFTQIEWLDFENSWEELNLSYNKINEEHQEFLDAADRALNNFGNSIASESSEVWKKLSSTSRKRDLNKGDLIGAGVQVAIAAGTAAILGGIETRNKSKEVVATIKRDVEILKLKMTEDNERIVADIFRLGKVYSKLTDSLLPNYQSFIEGNSKTIVSDLKPFYDRIMQNPIINGAKTENNELFERKRFLEQKIIDFKSNIEYSKEEEIRLGEILDFKKEEYELVSSLKPKKPFILIDILTFGRSGKIYNETFQQWSTYCKPVVEDYHYLQGLQKEEAPRRESINNEILKCENELNSINQKISSNSEVIKSEYEKSPFTDEEMIKLLTVVKKIINASRGVLEVELESDLQKKAVV